MLGQLSRDRRHTRQPTGALGSQAGNLALARCLVQSNADSRSVPAARGTIYVYGVDGVCHPLANQVIYATSGTRLTVNKARGYFFSTYLIWNIRSAACRLGQQDRKLLGSHRGNAALPV